MLFIHACVLAIIICTLLFLNLFSYQTFPPAILVYLYLLLIHVLVLPSLQYHLRMRESDVTRKMDITFQMQSVIPHNYCSKCNAEKYR